jgi:hypothetical protein
MSKKIIVNPYNETFAKLMRSLAKAIRTGDEKLTAEVKAEFAEYDTTLFYNAERDEIRILVKDCPPVDFPVSQFSDIVPKKVK